MFNKTNFDGFLVQLARLNGAAYDCIVKNGESEPYSIKIEKNGDISYEIEKDNNECDCRQFTYKTVKYDDFVAYLKQIGFNLELD